MSLKVWATNSGVLNVTSQIYFLGDDSTYHILEMDSDGILYESGTSTTTPSGALEIGNVDLGPYLFFGGRKLAVQIGSLTDLGAVSSPTVKASTAIAKVSEPTAGPSFYMQSDSGMYHRFRMMSGFLTVVTISPTGPSGTATQSFISVTAPVLSG